MIVLLEYSQLKARLKMAEAAAVSDERHDSWEKFHRWISCVCVVTFDLELGQALELVIPKDYPLSEKEKSNICYLAFPDSNSGCLGDTQFHFRIKCSGPGCGGTSSMYMAEHSAAPLVLMPDQTHYFGYVYFRQVKDADIKRGYFQKVQKIASDYFTNGEPSLEAVCHSINQWPYPWPGHVIHLPLMGELVYIRIPSKADKPSAAKILTNSPAVKSASTTIVIPSVYEPSLYQALHLPVVSNFETIWELVLLNEPLAVMAASPTLCANAVQALVSLIHPLKYCGDYRPYFTIHDSEFKAYTTKTQPPPLMILGVTNPFFTKTLEHWPHIVRIGEPTTKGHESTTKVYRRSTSSGGKFDTMDMKPGIYTRYHPCLSHDKVFAKLLTSKTILGKRPLEVQNALIRKQALELTTSFIIPLERYLSTLMPLKRDVSPWKMPPQLKPFDPEDFLESVAACGPQLTSQHKGNWTALYRAFFKTPNFVGWLNTRREEANQKLRLLHLDMLCKADVMFWTRGKQEIEVVDFLIRMKECMEMAKNQHMSISPLLLQALHAQAKSILAKLPDDLQLVLANYF
ncbi:protein DENND6B-like isoform X2 [Dysidea avara]|uniref:protein DENND6B-like isoform X2 n=1 Tax=Dysidea avara TaxID=196820 RepID=UPI003326C10D